MNHSGKLLREYRLRQGLSQNQLARKIGYGSGQYVSNIERGVSLVPADKIVKLAKIVGTKPYKFKAALLRDYKTQLDLIVK